MAKQLSHDLDEPTKENTGALLGFEQPVEQLRNALAAFPWDADLELAFLSVRHVANVLNRFVTDRNAAVEVENWANAVEGRDDIGFESENEQRLRELVHELANPLLAHHLHRSIRSRRHLPWLSKEAIDACCDDPLVKYVHVRYILDAGAASAQDIAKAYVSAAEGMEQSRYHRLLKFYPCFRAAAAADLAYPQPGTNSAPEAVRYRQRAFDHLYAAVRDRSTPVEEMYSAAHALLHSVQYNSATSR